MKIGPVRSTPYVTLVTNLAQRAKANPRGVHDLAPPERHFFTVALMWNQVYGGGVTSFLRGRNAALLGEVVTGLGVLHATQTQALLLLAAAHVQAITLPRIAPISRRMEQSLVGRIPCNGGAAWLILEAEIDDLLFTDPDRLQGKLCHFAQAHGMFAGLSSGSSSGLEGRADGGNDAGGC